VLNDWSARDLQRRRCVSALALRRQGLRHSLGPVLVTPDEFERSAGAMIARVNGEERSRGELGAMHHHWDALLARAAQNTVLRPRRRDRVRHRRDRLHPRGAATDAGCSAVRSSARDRRHRRAAQFDRVIGPVDIRAAARVLEGVVHRTRSSGRARLVSTWC